MTPVDLKSKENKQVLQCALAVLANVILKGKSEDTNQDITKSSSLPTLLISILRNTIKSDLSEPELLCDLVKNIALLGKSSFNKSIGIEPIFMKGFIPLIPFLLNEQPNKSLRLAATKALGVFISLASIIPVRSVNFYKELIDQKIIALLTSIVSSCSQAEALHKAAIHAISILISPLSGDTYSFPWKRGPHDAMNELMEAMPVFENARQLVQQ